MPLGVCRHKCAWFRRCRDRLRLQFETAGAGPPRSASAPQRQAAERARRQDAAGRQRNRRDAGAVDVESAGTAYFDPGQVVDADRVEDAVEGEGETIRPLGSGIAHYGGIDWILVASAQHADEDRHRLRLGGCAAEGQDQLAAVADLEEATIGRPERIGRIVAVVGGAARGIVLIVDLRGQPSSPGRPTRSRPRPVKRYQAPARWPAEKCIVSYAILASGLWEQAQQRRRALVP